MCEDRTIARLYIQKTQKIIEQKNATKRNSMEGTATKLMRLAMVTRAAQPASTSACHDTGGAHTRAQRTAVTSNSVIAVASSFAVPFAHFLARRAKSNSSVFGNSNCVNMLKCILNVSTCHKTTSVTQRHCTLHTRIHTSSYVDMALPSTVYITVMCHHVSHIPLSF